MSDERQKNQPVLTFMEESRSEAPTASVEGTESLAAKRGSESPAIGEQLMEEIRERENCKQALARVKANKGSAGVDGMTVQQFGTVGRTSMGEEECRQVCKRMKKYWADRKRREAHLERARTG